MSSILTGIIAAASAVGRSVFAPPQPPQPPQLTRNRALESLEQAVHWPEPQPSTVMLLANEYLAGHHDRAGYTYFEARARQSPDQPLFDALTGLFQARTAAEIPLLDRVAWVDGAIARLDRAARHGGLARYLRGIVFAELPSRFQRATQAVEDLEAMLAHPEPYPPGFQRGAWRGLAKAYAMLARPADAERARARAGGTADGPMLLTDASVSAADGFRFVPPTLLEVGPGIYVAQGYDFADLAFVVTGDGIVAIDAGTTPETAAAAVAALRARTSVPIRRVIVTHAHWDHIGGLAALLAPGVEVIAQARFADELAIANTAEIPFHFFFGAHAHGPYNFAPTRLIDQPESLTLGGIRFVLRPIHGGETDDALLVQLPDAGVTFVGDAFMPYLGAPFAAEGSATGLLATIAELRALGPARLIHGHAPLTRNFSFEVLEPLGAALAAVHQRTLAAIHDGHTLPDILGENLLPASLAAHPDAVVPFLLMRDNLVQRDYVQRTGYWKPDGEGMEVFTRAEWGRAADLLAGGREAAFRDAAATLNQRGDYGMALRLAELGLAAHPGSAGLAAQRRHALDGLRSTYQFNPFRFLIYSEMAGAELPPLAAR
jgi:glyoxylase-like metal-dependent hydrolase (beta-lactamase superfamily II)